MAVMSRRKAYKINSNKMQAILYFNRKRRKAKQAQEG